MRLIDFQDHLLNNNVNHAFRMPGATHDVYEKDGIELSICIEDDELLDDYCTVVCHVFRIEGINGEPID